MFGNVTGFIAVMLHSRGKMEKAGHQYEMALKRGMSKPEYLSACGVYFLRTGQFERARDLMEAMLQKKLKPKHIASAKYNLAISYWKTGNNAKAMEILDDMLKNTPTASAYVLMGHLLNTEGDLDRALEFNTDAIKYDEDDGDLYDNLGNTYLLRGELDKARENLQKALEIRPEMVDANYHLACVYAAEGKTEHALDILRALLDRRYTPIMSVTREDVEGMIEKLENEKAGA